MASVDITRVAGNIGAMQAFEAMEDVNKRVSIAQTRLSTGKRLNTAEDDPAGMNMAITFDIRRMDMKVAIAAIGDAKNLLSVAETGLRKIADILSKIKNKAMEAGGATIGNPEREAIASQMNSYTQEINQIVQNTNWNGMDLIGVSASATKYFFVGVSGAGGIAVFTPLKFSGAGSAGFMAEQLGLKPGTSGSAAYTAADLIYFGANPAGSATLNSIINALTTVKAGLMDVGTLAARLTFKEDVMAQAHTNTEAAYNRIMNANMAEEQIENSKYTILQQTSTAMLAQANASPQNILSLFR